MTRDGAISVNLVTGEATHISDRPSEQDYSSADETAGALNRAADEVVGHRERRQAKKARRKRRDTFREGEAARDRPSSRLQFSETDQGAPELKKAIRKSDKAADRLDAAKAAVPVKPPGKEHGNPLSRPVQEIRSTLHGEVSKVEGDNSGVQAGHLGERQIEKAVGYGNRRFHQARADRKLKPWRDVKQAEQAAVKPMPISTGGSPSWKIPSLRPVTPPPACAEKAAAKAVCRRTSGRNRRGPGCGKGVPDRRFRSEERRRDHRPEAGRACVEEQTHPSHCGRDRLDSHAHHGADAVLHFHVRGGTSGLVASSYLSEDADLTGGPRPPIAGWRRTFKNTWTPTRPPTTMTNITLTWTRSEHDPYVLLSILSALHEGCLPWTRCKATWKCSLTSSTSSPKL